MIGDWWHAKRKNRRRMPELIAQETRERYWHADDWRKLIEEAVDSVFGSEDATRDPQHLNTENRIRWACAEIGQVKNMLHHQEDKIGVVDSKLEHLTVVLSKLSKSVGVETTTESIANVAISKKVANILKGSREYTGDHNVAAGPASQSTGAPAPAPAKVVVTPGKVPPPPNVAPPLSTKSEDTPVAAPAPHPGSSIPGKGPPGPAPPLPPPSS